MDTDEFLMLTTDTCITPLLQHMDKSNAAGITMQRTDMGNEGDIVDPHPCKVHTQITSPYDPGYGHVAKVMCHNQRSKGNTFNMPHCCQPKEGHAVLYPTVPEPIPRDDLDQCYVIREDVRGMWNDVMAFVQHRPRSSLYDMVMKRKREKYGTNHGDMFKDDVLSISEIFTDFMSNVERESEWGALPETAARIRANLTNFVQQVMGPQDEETKANCSELRNRTEAFHKMWKSRSSPMSQPLKSEKNI